METLKDKTIDAVEKKFGSELTPQVVMLVSAAADIDCLVVKLSDKADDVARAALHVVAGVEKYGWGACPNSRGVLQNSAGELDQLCRELHVRKECFKQLCLVVGVEVIS